MNFDFLKVSADFETTYFLVFGSVLLFGLTILLWGWVVERRQRKSHQSQK